MQISSEIQRKPSNSGFGGETSLILVALFFCHFSLFNCDSVSLCRSWSREGCPQVLQAGWCLRHKRERLWKASQKALYVFKSISTILVAISHCLLRPGCCTYHLSVISAPRRQVMKMGFYRNMREEPWDS